MAMKCMRESHLLLYLAESLDFLALAENLMLYTLFSGLETYYFVEKAKCHENG